MKEIILSILNLQGLDRELIDCRVQGDQVVLEFGDSREAVCPRCGGRTGRRHAWGKRRRIYHGAGLGKTFWLELRTSRYLCLSCRKPFTEGLWGVGSRQRKTVAAERGILEALRGRSFKSVAEREGISYGVSKRVLERCLEPGRVAWPEQGEIVLGIDGHSFRGPRMVQTVTDIHSRRALTILPDSRQESVRGFLRAIPPEVKTRIREVCIDMNALLLAAAEEELPGVPVVADHFHLIQDANQRLDEARRIEQDAAKREIPRLIFLLGKEKLSRHEKKRVEEYGLRYPTLKEFYWMKEALRAFYRLRSRPAAARKLKDLIAIALMSDDAAMVQWGRTLKRWSPYILNFFSFRTTNAYTEGVHTKIKMIKRVSFGFRNVQVYVRKVLLCLWPLTIILPCLPHFSS